MENLNDAEFGSDKTGEEAPLLVAQRYLNIFRQVHIFNKAKRDEFDDELLALPQNITDFFKKMPGGRLLVEHIEKVKTERGIAFVKANLSEFDEGSGKTDTPQVSTTGGVVQAVSGTITLDDSFADKLAQAMANAFKQLPQNPIAPVASGASTITADFGNAFDIIAEEIRTSRASLLDVLKETRSITDSVIASQVSISRILEGILSTRDRDDTDIADLNNRIIASQASITKLLEGLYTANSKKNNEISEYLNVEKRLQRFREEITGDLDISLQKMQELFKVCAESVQERKILIETVPVAAQATSGVVNPNVTDKNIKSTQSVESKPVSSAASNEISVSDITSSFDEDLEQTAEIVDEHDDEAPYGISHPLNNNNTQSISDPQNPLVEGHKKKKKKKKKNRDAALSQTSQNSSDNHPTAQTERVLPQQINQQAQPQVSTAAVEGVIRNPSFKHQDDFKNVDLNTPPLDTFDDINDTSTSNDFHWHDVTSFTDNEEKSLTKDTSFVSSPDLNSMDEESMLSDFDDLDFSLPSNDAIQQNNASREDTQTVGHISNLDDLNDGLDDDLDFALPQVDHTHEDYASETSNTENSLSFDNLIDEDTSSVLGKSDDDLNFALPSTENKPSSDEEDLNSNMDDIPALDSFVEDNQDFSVPEFDNPAQAPVSEYDHSEDELQHSHLDDFNTPQNLADSLDDMYNNSAEGVSSTNMPLDASLDQETSSISNSSNLLDDTDFTSLDNLISSSEVDENDVTDDTGLDQFMQPNPNENDHNVEQRVSPNLDATPSASLDDFVASNIDTQVEQSDLQPSSSIDDLLMEENAPLQQDEISSSAPQEVSHASDQHQETPSRYSAELDKIRQALTADSVDLSSLDQPIELDDYSDDENVGKNDYYDDIPQQNNSSTHTQDQQPAATNIASDTSYQEQASSNTDASSDEDWEWEYVDENGNEISSDEDQDWEWEYVEDDEDDGTQASDNTITDNKK